MKVIVTGGAGFIGSHLVEKLINQNHKVIVIDNLSTGRLENIKKFLPKIKFIKADISKINRIKKYFKGVDRVFHLAALADIVPSIQNPNEYYDSNVTGTLNVLECSKYHKVKKFLYAASSSCYGIPKNYPTDERQPFNPQYPYALTKMMGEQLILHWSQVYKLKYISLRLFNVYGTRSRTSGTYGAMFGVFLAQKLFNAPLTIVGNGKQTRDFTYVSDVVDAFVCASNSKVYNQIFNVGSGKTIAVNKIASLLSDKKTYMPKRPGEPDSTFANINKIKKLLSWKPKIDIEKGIKLILKDINYWSKAPVWTPKSINKATKDWFKYLK
jgi:UDP-glucose 4-epimerase|tara:strand:- start:404 stop:1381 length:978 start_codon:yes stop_codon:yes gene_type:complete